MRKLRAWLLRLWSLPNRNVRDREFSEEIETHLQLHIADNLRSGMTPEQARRDAVLALGVESSRQAYREGSTVQSVETLLQDLRYTVRQLRKNPGFAATAVLVLTLGIAATVAIFSFVDAALIRPLPYRDPSRLVVVFGSIPLGPKFHLSFPDYHDMKRLNTVFSSFEVYETGGFMLSTPSGTQQAPGTSVSAGFFRALGVAPVVGRDFVDGEDKLSAPRTVLLSYAAWQKRYSGRADVLGKTVVLDGRPNTIIGVLPRGFHFAPGEPADFWTADHNDNSCRGCHALFGLGRLKDGVTLAAAAANMTAIARQLELQYSNSNTGQGASTYALSEVILGDIRPILLVLLGGAGLLLLIACVNVASLLLVRAQSRKHEIAVRGALGASRQRLLRQFVTEGLVLATTASGLGLAVAYGAIHLLVGLIPTEILAGMPYLQGMDLTPRVLLLALAITLLTTVLFSVTPILNLSMEELRTGLTEGARGSVGTVWRKFGSNLVVVELATATVLLVGAGLLGKSFYELLRVDPGLQPDNLATLHLEAPREAYAKDAQSLALEKQVAGSITALPGVVSVGAANKLPIGDGDWTTSIEIAGRPHSNEHNEVAWRRTTPGYFRTLGARLLEGRYFAEGDDATKPSVALINKALARQYFPGEDPVGKRINYEGAPATSEMQIVGLIDDVREGPLDTAPRAALYIPFYQSPLSFFSIVVRTSVDAQAILPVLEETIHRIDPNIATFDAATMQQRIHDSQAEYLHRASAWLVGGFAALALLLSVVGLYGVIAYSVGRRTREIGVRMALGAQRRTVYLLVLSEAARLIAVGIFAGLIASVGASAFMSKLLFGTKSWDVFTLMAVSVALGTAALAASYLPARRAASVNPMEALRAE